MFKFLILCLTLSSTSLVFGQIQSEFKGPLKLKVWEHWQPSWNVENATQESDYQFNLVRGFNNGNPFVTLKYRKTDVPLTAQVRCDSYVKKDTWSVQEVQGQEIKFSGTKNGALTEFLFKDAKECLDVSGERIVTSINIQIFANNVGVFSYSLKPMYVRGVKNYYWSNQIDSYSAHAGSGQITVSNTITGESGWDKWNGTLVRPTISYVDRNTMGAGAIIGLHRHENNQEIFKIESGRAKMLVGVAQKTSDVYKTQRLWNSTGEIHNDVSEFTAGEGWIEERMLGPGELSVIVPTPGDSNTVYFHGIEAVAETTFWTMGSRN